MVPDTIDKQQLINWIEELTDPAMLHTIQSLKEHSQANTDFWDDLPEPVKSAINKAKTELDDGASHSHKEVMDEVKSRFLTSNPD
jgi:hypothetical protein